MSKAAEKAKEFLASGTGSVDELKQLVDELKGEWQYGLARKLLGRLQEMSPQDDWVAQQLALCTYKDEELLPAYRFERALAILDERLKLRDPNNKNAETLALGGAVYKRRWAYNGQLDHLYQALTLYRAAYERNPDADKGYGGVNAAYILDLLAARARQVAHRSGIESKEAEVIASQAGRLRAQMAEKVQAWLAGDPGLRDRYWFAVTAAEIFFGLGDYEEAGNWLAHARGLPKKPWEQQTTFHQLVSLARLHGYETPKEKSDPSTWAQPWQALARFIGDESDGQAERALSCYRGRIGLALSGGGLRASLYHLGVLARLADMDVLRGVEVLSTVSGGSIVGAHYYLEVKELLGSTPDEQINREHYVEIVRKLQRDFLAGVQRNLRTRALANFGKNLKLIFSKQYTRSHRMGELYEKELYARVDDGHPMDAPRRMRGLFIRPEGDPHKENFKPKFSNWRRRAKVPVLLLNTTSLNSGHSWHFTASWMGEPPGLVGSKVDKNARYRRLYYWQAPTEALQNYRLGHAVAASACVPGLFEPLVIQGLYPERTVRLVDGGVHDNQGVGGLLDEACTLILASDASGQMDDLDRPSDTALGVPLRANSILMDRVREAEYQDLRARVDSHALEGLLFVHLKHEFHVPALDWIDCQDPSPKTPPGGCTPYGIDRDMQKRLANIRTDLDSFTEVEASALMASGYLMTAHEFKELQRQHERDGQPGTWGDFNVHADDGDWSFLALKEIMAQPETSDDPRRRALDRQLEVGSKLFFKVWRLHPLLSALAALLLVAAVLVVLWLVVANWDRPLREAPILLGQVALAVILLGAALAVPATKWLFPERATRGYVTKAVLAVIGFVGTRLHLAVFDKLFLAQGKLERLLKLKS